MRQPRFMFVAVAAAVALVVAAPSQASPAGGPVDRGHIDAYTATVTPEQRSQLARLGHDLSEQGHTKDKVQLYLTPSQADEVRKLGINPQLTRVKGGKTVREFAAEQALNGFTVWRSYDEVGGIRDQMYAAAAANSSIAKLVKLGNTVQGREILAVKLTQGAPGQVDGSRPAVLYSSTQHAREWISTEVNRRLMNWYIDKWKANDPGVKALLQSTELWFVLVANPDGYQYTFDHERLWRKTLRDNNNDGEITVGDGVDPNRNWPNHWGYDNEGSSDVTSSETYRGVAPASEPETLRPQGPARQDRLRLPGELALRGAVVALRRGLADRHADRGRPDLLRHVRQPGQAGDRGLPPRSQLGRSVRHQRRDDRLRPRGHRCFGVDPGAVRRLRGVRFRLPGRRRTRAGGVPPQPAVRRLGGALRRRP